MNFPIIAKAALICCMLTQTSSYSGGDIVDNIRTLHDQAISDPRAIAPALDAVNSFLDSASDDAVVLAYKGSLLTLKAKEATLPWNKLSYLREGNALMDNALTRLSQTPSHGLTADLEVRVIRGITHAMIPVLYGYSGDAKEDLTLALKHTGFRHLTPTDQVRVRAWLAVVLYRDSEDPGLQEKLLGEARAVDAAEADMIWGQR